VAQAGIVTKRPTQQPGGLGGSLNPHITGRAGEHASPEEIARVVGQMPRLPDDWASRRNRGPNRAAAEQRYQANEDFEQRCYKMIAERENQAHSSEVNLLNTAAEALREQVRRFITNTLYSWHNHEGTSKEQFCNTLNDELHPDFTYTFNSPDEDARCASGRKSACKCFASRHGFGVHDPDAASNFRHSMELISEGPRVMVKVSEKTNQDRIVQIDYYTFTFAPPSGTGGGGGALLPLLLAIDHSRFLKVQQQQEN